MIRSLVLLAGMLVSLGACAPTPGGAQESPATLNQQIARAEQRREYDRATELLTKAIEEDPQAPQPYYRRGRANFCAGRIEQSIADFDKYVELNPDAKSRQWERGIALYYAGEFQKGAEQFELYQTYHNQDVENSAWRYLCVARAEGVEKAQANMLPIDNDPRVPMMQIYDLYRGRRKPDDVLAAARAGDPLQAELNTRLFYAHLYLGLWHEAAGRAKEAQENLFAAEKHKIGHYMWDVAHVHAERLRAAEKPQP